VSGFDKTISYAGLKDVKAPGMELGPELHAEHGPAVANSLHFSCAFLNRRKASIYNMHAVAIDFCLPVDL
jgi:hypothetical protein